MKKFFTVIPLQVRGQLDRYHYEAIGNEKLEMGTETSFPILTALNGYAEQGEEIRVIAVATDIEAAAANRAAFEEETRELCEKKGVSLPYGVEFILVPQDDRVATHADTFRKLIDYVEDEDELFACMTYGTKPQSMALMMAMRYAFRVKDNVLFSCIVYGAVERPSQDRSQWRAKVYDMTTLLQLEELTRLLAEQNVKDPRDFIDGVFSL